MICAMRIDKWFAWRPVFVDDKVAWYDSIAWLRTVSVIRHHSMDVSEFNIPKRQYCFKYEESVVMQKLKYMSSVY